MVARVDITENQQVGSLFVPMHWNDFIASKGRVNSLVNPVVDPISGQPESKHTPVQITAYQPNWYGFILSRSALTINSAEYWVKIKGVESWRYEVAGEQPIDNPSQWAKNQLGDNGEWLEFSDKSTQSFRAAKIINNRLDSVIFMSSKPQLPTRTWLTQLFSEPVISDETRLNLLAGKAGAGVPDVGPIVCACFSVGENTIKEAIKKGTAKTVEDLGAELKAGTNCGSCIPELKRYF